MLFALGCSSGPGPAGPPGEQGPPGDQGPPGSVVLTGAVSGAVTDGAHPLSGVSVTASPGGSTATTDGAGAFTFAGLDFGPYDLGFHLAGYDDRTIPISVTPSGPTTVAVTLVADPIVVTVSDQLTAGFGAPVTLKATAVGTGALTYAWTQTAGPPVTVTGAGTGTLSFTTLDFATAMGPLVPHNARFGVLGVDPDQAGGYAFQLTVSDTHGHATRATVAVSSTRPTSGLRMVPVGVPVWLQGDGPLVSAAQTTWSWTLGKAGAPGSGATIADPTSQFPSFVPDVPGTYTVTEAVASKTLTIYAGTWLGEMTPSAMTTCTLCHNGTIAPDVFTPWMGTKHHAALQEELDGEDGPGFAEPCLTCHTVGYDKSAANGGFDDVEATSGWAFPAKLQAGNWARAREHAGARPARGHPVRELPRAPDPGRGPARQRAEPGPRGPHQLVGGRLRALPPGDPFALRGLAVGAEPARGPRPRDRRGQRREQPQRRALRALPHGPGLRAAT